MGDLLSAAEIDYLAGEAQQAMPDEAVILRGTMVSNAGGGGSQTLAPDGTFPCRIAPIAGQEMTEGSRTTAELEAIVTLPAATPVDVENQIRIGAVDYDVVQVKPRESWEVTRRVQVKEVS